jgi:2'-5' RNA ligase
MANGKRCFISVNFPDEIKKEIIKTQEKLPAFFGKKTEENNIQLTLKFLGEVEEKKIKEVRRRLERIEFKELNCEINSIGVFTENFIKIIWLHLKGCEKLQKDIDESVKELFKEEERFMSHITIARVKKVKNKKQFIEAIKKIKIKMMNFKISEFCFMKSALTAIGPEYKIIESFKAK